MMPPLRLSITLGLLSTALTAISADAPLTLTLQPVADAEVVSNEGVNLNKGSQASVSVQKGGGRDWETYLKFEVTESRTDVARATLRIFVAHLRKGDPTKPVGVWTTASNWSESTLTYNNRPTTGPQVADFATIPILGTWMEADVTRVVTGPGTYSFRLAGPERYKVVFPSREATDPAVRPMLRLSYGPWVEASASAASAAVAPAKGRNDRIRPVDDVWLDAHHAGPSDPLLRIGGPTAREAFLAFDLNGANGDVTRARLRIHSTGGGAGQIVRLHTTGNGWNEAGLAWSGRPAALPAKPLAESNLPEGPGWIEFDVLPAVTGTGRYSFILSTDSPRELTFDARESSARAPEFVVDHQPGLNKRVPDVLASGERILSRFGDPRLSRDGILDVTLPPYCADPTGRTDSTLAIQRALNEGRDARCVTYLPAGTYLVSATLEGISPGYLRGGFAGVPLRRREFGCVLQGPADPGERAVLRLAPGTPGFGDPANPRPVLHFWAATGTPPNVYEKSNANFSQQIRNLSVTLGGNAGAIGVEFLACEDSALQCVRVDATGAFAGFKDGLGSGGGMHDLSVTGGRYGAYLSNTQPTCSLSHATFRGQTVACVFNDSRGPLVMPGAVLAPASGAVAVMLAGQARGVPYNASLCLVDSRIELAPGSSVPAIVGNRSVYLNQVYLENAATLVKLDDAGPGLIQPGRADGWCHVPEFAAAASVVFDAAQAGGGDPVRPDVVYVDGRRRDGPPDHPVWTPVDAADIPSDLQSRHTWTGVFPGVGTPGMLNARDFGATGDADHDDFTDQHPALQRAIDEASARNLPLFLPRGIYRIARTLDLHANTTLVGASHLSTLILPLIDPAKHPDGDFLDGDNPRPLLRTADDAAATTRLGHIGLYLPLVLPPGLDEKFYPAYAVLWRAGRNSVIRSLKSVRIPGRGAVPDNGPFFIFRGNGGGRAYGLKLANYEPMTRRFTNCLIDGTHEPLAIYHFQPQGASEGYAGSEIRGARNVDAFGIKYEGIRSVVVIRDSRHIRLFGESGGGSPKVLFLVENSEDFLLSNLYPMQGKVTLGERDSVRENGIGTGDRNQMLLYKRGNP